MPKIFKILLNSGMFWFIFASLIFINYCAFYLNSEVTLFTTFFAIISNIIIIYTYVDWYRRYDKPIWEDKNVKS